MPRRSWAAAALGATLLAGACGGDDGANNSSSSGQGARTGGTIDQSISDALHAKTEPTTAGDGPTMDEPTSMEEWEALWAEERAAVVARITENGWGISADGTTITGPEGFTVDLTGCAEGWSNTEGLTDTTFKVGQAIAQSGTFADYGNYGKAIEALLDHYGKQGAFTDSNGKTRTALYIQKDDGYDPARTIPIVDELLDSEKSFAIWTLGTPSTMKVYDKLNQRCVPHLMAMTAHPAWGDPVNHPWTSGAPAPAYTTETQLWGTFIEQHEAEFGDEIKVAALVMNNDFGKVYEAGFKAWLAQSSLGDRVDLTTEMIEPQAPTVTDPMTTLAAEDPDVFIAMTAGASCTQAVIEAAQNGMKESVPYLFQPLTCAGTTFLSKERVGGDGTASDGWWIFNPGVKDIRDESMSEDPWVEWERGLLVERGIDPMSSSSFGGGFGYGFPFVQTVLIAQELPGGLTRANLLVAHRALDMTPPTHGWGLRLHLDGNKDSFLLEGGSYNTFSTEKQTWVSAGDLIDLDGKSQNCAWDQSVSACR